MRGGGHGQPGVIGEQGDDAIDIGRDIGIGETRPRASSRAPAPTGASWARSCRSSPGSELIAAFGDDTTAVIVYDTATVPVASAPAAECVTVTDGKITRSRLIFDRLPFNAARNPAG
jgi:hypothetical protein